MKKILFIAALLSPFTFHLSPCHAQSDPVILEVGGRQIRQSEFMKDFRQSVGDNLSAKHGVSEAEKRAALDEYVELYANFQAKYLDALAQGLDTAADLRKELSRYRKDLAAPYLIDSAALSSLLHEAYERNRYSLHAAHILVRVNSDATPEDTLAAYNRAQELYQRVKAGEDFYAVAREEVLRLNAEAQVHPNEGELNCFTVFEMVYPFENAAYALQDGEISQPVRTQYGYHIIKLFERSEVYGRATIQHIWLRSSANKIAIERIYNLLENGTSFESLALQSEDLSTARTGGYINDASMGQLPHEYVVEIAKLQEGQYSKPFQSRYGWHIIKVVKKEQIPPYESMVSYYKQRMARDQRGNASRKLFAENSRKKYGIRDLTTTPVADKTKAKGKKKSKKPAVMMASLDEITSLLNDTVFRGKWKYQDSMFHDLRPLVTTPDKEYNVIDFAKYIKSHQRVEIPASILFYVQMRYDEFLDSVTVAYVDSQLEKEYPEFAEVVDEYRRGLMIFNYNEKMIWTKAINDSVGFSKFYARESAKKSLQNPDDSLFFWRTRARIVDFTVADSLCLDPDKAIKIVKKGLDKNLASTEIRDMLVKKVNSKRCKNADPVKFTIELVEQGRKAPLADDQWKRGVYAYPNGKGYHLLMVQNVIAPCLKAQMEARGYYLSAWQNEVEKELCESLRAQYKVKINYDALRKIAF